MHNVGTAFAQTCSYLAGVGMTALTTYLGLLIVGRAKAGLTVVASATGGAVRFIVYKIARIQGCKSVGVFGSSEKCSQLRNERGVENAIEYKKGAVAKVIKLDAPNSMDVYSKMSAVTFGTQCRCRSIAMYASSYAVKYHSTPMSSMHSVGQLPADHCTTQQHERLHHAGLPRGYALCF